MTNPCLSVSLPCLESIFVRSEKPIYDPIVINDEGEAKVAPAID